MNLAILAAAAALTLAAYSGCTLIPTAHGTVQFWGDYDHPKFSDNGKVVKFEANSMTHSPIVRAHYHGVSKVAAQGVAAMMPGDSVVKGAINSGAVISTLVPEPAATPAPVKAH